jgi:tetratricopeptide (TPR) repeat protein
MTAQAMPSAARRWLFGPRSDLLLGCGGAYGLAFAAQSVAPDAMREIFPLWIYPFITLVLGAPHYGATLLRAYGTEEARRRYAALGIWLTAVMAIAYVVGVRNVLVGSAILTLYIAWSPWHYSGQNYGVAMTFLRRRGVPISPLAKRLVHASFVSSYLLTLLALFGPTRQGYAAASYQGTVYHLLPIGLPAESSTVVFPLVAAVYAACVIGAAVLLLRAAPRARELVPVGLLALTQALWFAGPTVARHWSIGNAIDPFSPENAAYSFMWVASGHFVQYLWITSYYAGAAGPAALGRYLGKALLVGSVAWALPALVFAPGVLGSLPFDMGLGVLTAATVNLHHFVLDGAIWKLRDGRVARVLLLAQPAEERFSPLDQRLARWGRPLVMGAGALCAAVLLTSFIEAEFGARRAIASGDFERMLRAAEWSERVGRASPRFHVQLARMAAERGDRAGARAHLERSLELWPTPDAYVELARWHEAQRAWREAAEARQKAVELAPEDAALHYQLGLAWMRLRETRKARDAFAQAVALAPDEPLPRRNLARAEALLAGQDAPDQEALAGSASSID